MIIKANDRQLTFSFQEADPFLEIGCKILEQENLTNMLPCAQKHNNGKEKLIFKYDAPNIVPLSEVLDKLSNNDIIDLLYELIFICEKVEENGFLKKECIWYKYEHLFYDTDTNRPMLAILPITGEFRYSDGLSWGRRIEAAAAHIVGFLPDKKAKKVRDIIAMFVEGKLTCDETLDEINELGTGSSGLLVDKTMPEPDIGLKLLYVSRDDELSFYIEDKDFVIGKDADRADGIISDELSRAVSRRHCVISKLNRKYFVQDLDSTNHTFVNGEVVPPYEIMELSHSDILSVADVEFRVNIVEV